MITEQKAMADENRCLRRLEKFLRPSLRKEMAMKAVATRGVSIALACRSSYSMHAEMVIQHENQRLQRGDCMDLCYFPIYGLSIISGSNLLIFNFAPSKLSVFSMCDIN